MKSIKINAIYPVILTAMIALSPGQALSIDSAGTYQAIGLGGNSCSEYTSAVAASKNSEGEAVINDTLANYLSYTFGFLTQTNRAVPGLKNFAEGETPSSLLSWMNAWCTSNPSLPYAQGLTVMEQVLIGVDREFPMPVNNEDTSGTSEN